MADTKRHNLEPRSIAYPPADAHGEGQPARGRL